MTDARNLRLVASQLQSLRAHAAQAAQWLKLGSLRRHLLFGPVGEGRPPLRVEFVGRQFLAEDVRTVFFPGESERVDLGMASPAGPKSRFDGGFADVRVTEEPPWSFNAPPGALQLATVVTAEIDLARCAEGLPAGMSRSHRGALHRAQRLGLTLRRSRSLAELRVFAEALLRPTVQARHGGHARHTSLEELRAVWDASELYFLEREDRVLGAFVLLLSPLRSRGEYWRCAVLPDARDEPELHHAVSMLQCHAALERVRALGLRWFSLGLVSPVLTHGLFQFKRRWGATFELSPSHPLCRIEFLSDRRYELLEARPMLVVDGGRLIGLVGAQAPLSAEAHAALWNKVRFPDLAGLRQVIPP